MCVAGKELLVGGQSVCGAWVKNCGPKSVGLLLGFVLTHALQEHQFSSFPQHTYELFGLLASSIWATKPIDGPSAHAMHHDEKFLEMKEIIKHRLPSSGETTIGWGCERLYFIPKMPCKVS